MSAVLQSMQWGAAGDLVWLGLLVSLAAGIARGLAGFGFSALTVAGLSLFIAPAPVVPAVMILEILASAVLWRASVRQIDARWLKSLLLGNLVCVPVGMYMLAHLDPVPLNGVLGSALLLTALTLRVRSARMMPDGPWVRAGAGALSGFLNGLAGSGGVAAAMLMAACHVAATALRGTMIVFLVFAALYTLLWAGIASQSSGAQVDLFSLQTVQWVLVLAPGLLLGNWLGSKAFMRAQPARFRLLVLNLLICISALSVARALWGGWLQGG